MLQNKGVIIGVWHFERETVGLFRSDARFCKENAIKGFEIAVKKSHKISQSFGWLRKIFLPLSKL
jgi:hypothetical protein